jgi:hypothetical protein
MGFCKRTLQSYVFNLDYQNRLYFNTLQVFA